jgi:hypothetical protein
VTLANLTNVEGSIIVAIVFPAIAAVVIFIRMRQRRQERAGGRQREPSLLERIEAMNNEEFEAWRRGSGQDKP